MSRTIIKTKNAPAAVGAYNQGIVANGFIFTAGQIPLNPKTNTIINKILSKNFILILFK